MRQEEVMNSISIQTVLVTFSMTNCVGSWLSKPCDSENGFMHSTKIPFISLKV